MTDISLSLSKGIHQLGLELSHEPFERYIQLLEKWNKAYNLTAIRNPQEMVVKHVLDSLSARCFLHGVDIIDVGTGPGVPGIILAMAHPEKTFFLLDSNGKKIRFLQAVKRECNLTNVNIIESRVETYKPARQFDTVISRAFSDMQTIIRACTHLLAPMGRIVAMKGVVPEAELKHLNQSFEVVSYQVPELDGQRCVVIINKES